MKMDLCRRYLIKSILGTTCASMVPSLLFFKTSRISIEALTVQLEATLSKKIGPREMLYSSLDKEQILIQHIESLVSKGQLVFHYSENENDYKWNYKFNSLVSYFEFQNFLDANQVMDINRFKRVKSYSVTQDAIEITSILQLT